MDYFLGDASKDPTRQQHWQGISDIDVPLSNSGYLMVGAAEAATTVGLKASLANGMLSVDQAGSVASHTLPAPFPASNPGFTVPESSDVSVLGTQFWGLGPVDSANVHGQGL